MKFRFKVKIFHALILSCVLHGLFFALSLQTDPQTQLLSRGEQRIEISYFQKETLSPPPKVSKKGLRKQKQMAQKQSAKAQASGITPSQQKKSSTASANAKIKDVYLAALRRHIVAQKHYPRLARKLKQEGLVVISLTIEKDGSFSQIKLQHPSNYETLNQASLEAVARVKSHDPFPTSLEAQNIQVLVPMEYEMENL